VLRHPRAKVSAGLVAAVMAIGVAAAPAAAQGPAPSPAPISAKRVNDAIAGGWLGAVVGGAWGYRTEFDFNGRVTPRHEIPPYRPKFTNKYTFGGSNRSAADETFVEIPLIDALRRNGLQAGWAQLAQPFAASRFLLFGANLAARANLRAGILPPESGAPAHNVYSDEIDFQIESDFIGLAAPAQPGAAVEMAWRLGHIMNYGDGVYGGVMVSAMHAAAFQARSIDEIVAAGQASVPEGTAYRQMIDDVIAWHRLYPGNWRATWNLLEQKWNHPDPNAPHPGELPGINVAASLNGGYMLLGLLYGRGSLERTIRVAILAGQDTDCNASNAASVLGTWLGRKKIPKRFKGVAKNRRIAGTDYTLRRAIAVNTQLASALTTLRGGAVTRRTWQIAPDVLQPPAFEQKVPGDTPPPMPDIGVETAGRTTHLQLDGASLRDVWWSFGDSSGAHGADVSHTYLRPGAYPINVWVTGAAGTTAHRELSVAIP
jgi:ADP-ribosylglycohydrolase/PKD domain-containing protein